jgi:hypothetical protein
MPTGPLSDRIDCITGRPPFETIDRQPDQNTDSASRVAESPEFFSNDSQELWHASQINCPIPPRCPDQWML